MSLFAAVADPVLRKEVSEGHSFEEIHGQYLQLIERHFPAQKEAALAVIGIAGRRRLLSENGGSVGVEAAAELFSPHREIGAAAIRKAAREGRIFGVRQGTGEWLFPVWQFLPDGGVWGGLPEVVAALKQSPDSSDAGLLGFFSNPHPLLDGSTPIEALRSGRRDQAIRAAQSQQY